MTPSGGTAPTPSPTPERAALIARRQESAAWLGLIAVYALTLTGCSRLVGARGQWILEGYNENGAYENRIFTFRKDGIVYRTIPYKDSCDQVLKYMHHAVPLIPGEENPLRLAYITSSKDPEQRVCYFKIVDEK
jgi:hypothetical protein